MTITKKTFYNNYNCCKKFWCKRYCSIIHEKYNEAINLEKECNAQNNYRYLCIGDKKEAF